MFAIMCSVMIEYFLVYAFIIFLSQIPMLRTIRAKACAQSNICSLISHQHFPNLYPTLKLSLKKGTSLYLQFLSIVYLSIT